jgi:hypothetical protein
MCQQPHNADTQIKAKVLQSADSGFIFTAPFVDSAFFGNPDECASLYIKVKS